jgi:hypothetical protein
MHQCDQRRQRFIIALQHRSDRTLECPPERMHRTNRSTKFGNRHKQSILAPQQSVSAHEQFVFRLRMQQLAHLMRLRALTIGERRDAIGFPTSAISQAVPEDARPSSEHNEGGQDESGNTKDL